MLGRARGLAGWLERQVDLFSPPPLPFVCRTLLCPAVARLSIDGLFDISISFAADPLPRDDKWLGKYPFEREDIYYKIKNRCKGGRN